MKNRYLLFENDGDDNVITAYGIVKTKPQAYHAIEHAARGDGKFRWRQDVTGHWNYVRDDGFQEPIDYQVLPYNDPARIRKRFRFQNSFGFEGSQAVSKFPEGGFRI